MFSWDTGKALQNYDKHGVPFEEAATVFADPEALDWEDIEHAVSEQRWKRLGFSTGGRVLLVVYALRRLKKWDGNDSHHQCAQGEPQRAASLRRIVVLIFPIFRSQRILNCGGLAESVALRLAMLSSSLRFGLLRACSRSCGAWLLSRVSHTKR